jgi:hypothetical protein
MMQGAALIVLVANTGLMLMRRCLPTELPGRIFALGELENAVVASSLRLRRRRTIRSANFNAKTYTGIPLGAG